ncbi:hypothetical protein [uncultured Bifidobacterium sp.]|uniref:hypothetical protein n=1 Tax=uncultured Bifidobacterium sp. TaxID=165187 RepID=UPI00265EF755|nr:hypothetical protein [uncultured Bifidobacterium sp.]
MPRYQRVTIPQDIALLDNAVPDEGLQDMHFNELKTSLYRHAEDERMHVTEYRDVNDLIKNKSKHAGFISIGPAPFEKNVLLRLHMRFSAKLVVRDSFVPSL